MWQQLPLLVDPLVGGDSFHLAPYLIVSQLRPKLQLNDRFE